MSVGGAEAIGCRLHQLGLARACIHDGSMIAVDGDMYGLSRTLVTEGPLWCMRSPWDWNDFLVAYFGFFSKNLETH